MQIPLIMSVDPEKLKTEERIIVAAIRVFSDTPVELASTRAIAKEAGVSLSALPYYFKTKENLYQAAINRIVDFVEEAANAKFSALPPIESLTPNEAKNMLRWLVDTLIDRIYDPGVITFAKIIMREHLSPSPVYDVIYQRFIKGLFNNVTKLLQRITPELSDEEAVFKIVWSFGQIVGFRIGRELLKRHVAGFVGFSTEEIAEIKALILRNVFRELEQGHEWEQERAS